MAEGGEAEAAVSATITEQPFSTVTTELQAAAEEATLNSNALGEAGTDSTCNNTESDPEKTLEFAAELSEKGTQALKDKDFAEAADCFSRALEIRVLHYGELAPECVNAYYLYGKALLYKAQEEADPLVAVPKKEGNESKQVSEGKKTSVNGDSSVGSASSNAEGEGSSHPQEEANGEGDDSGDSEDDEDLAEADEDESDLDLAWKMLDLARAIADKQDVDSMDKVDILSALAEVALEREDIDTSLSDYKKALSMLEQLVEPDNRYIAELNFRICLCLEFGYKPQEAIPFCQKAISVCKSRLQRLMNEVKSFSELEMSSPSGANDGDQQLPTGFQSNKCVADKEAEIETLTGLSGELEKKLEDLQQLIANPKSFLLEVLGMVSKKANSGEKGEATNLMSPSQMATANSGGGFDSPTVSTAHTNGAAGVTHLGIVGRGVKRVLMNTGSIESSPSKKPAMETSSDKGDGSNC